MGAFSLIVVINLLNRKLETALGSWDKLNVQSPPCVGNRSDSNETEVYGDELSVILLYGVNYMSSENDVEINYETHDPDDEYATVGTVEEIYSEKSVEQHEILCDSQEQCNSMHYSVPESSTSDINDHQLCPREKSSIETPPRSVSDSFSNKPDVYAKTTSVEINRCHSDQTRPVISGTDSDYFTPEKENKFIKKTARRYSDGAKLTRRAGQYFNQKAEKSLRPDSDNSRNSSEIDRISSEHTYFSGSSGRISTITVEKRMSRQAIILLSQELVSSLPEESKISDSYS